MQRQRASAVCIEAGELLCVRLRDPVTGIARLFVPGGGMDAGETPAQAAAREAFEETGYRVQVDAASEHVARYLFVWAGIPVECTTHFFRARLLGDKRAPENVHDAVYNEGVVWLPLAELAEAFAFHAEICAAVTALAHPITTT